MRDLMNLVNDVAPLVKIGWLVFFVWALVQIAWYRRARRAAWPRTAPARPLPRKVAPPIARTVAMRPAPAATAPAPEPVAPTAGVQIAEPIAADATDPAAAPKPARRRRRQPAPAATVGA